MINPAQVSQTTPNSSVTLQNPAKIDLQALNVTPASIKSWITGQILQATVIQQLSSSTVLLNIGNTEFTAQTKLQLPAGSELRLKVARTNDQPLLQIINNPTSKTNTNVTALRQVIPRQIPLSDFFSNLKIVNSTEQRLPQIIHQAIQSLQSEITSRIDLVNPEMIKKAIAENGSFFESNLNHVKTTSVIEGDLKGKLLRLAVLLASENTTTLNKTTSQKQTNNNLLAMLTDNKVLPDLRRHVDSAVARIQLNQLNSLPANEHNSQAFLLELPVKENENIDVFSLKINEEGKHQQDPAASKRWSIRISFDLSGLGIIHAKLILGGKQIQASLWAEEEATFVLIQNNLKLLHQRLTDVEFIDPEIKCFNGKPESEICNHSAYNELIDIEI